MNYVRNIIFEICNVGRIMDSISSLPSAVGDNVDGHAITLTTFQAMSDANIAAVRNLFEEYQITRNRRD